MLLGNVDRIDRTTVQGWAADPDVTDDCARVAIYVDGKQVTEIICDAPRADVKSVISWRDGLCGFTYTFPAPVPEDADHWVAVRLVRTGELLPNGEKQLPALPSAEPRSEPNKPRDLRSYVDTITRNHVSGWVANPDAPDEPIDIAVIVNGQVSGRAPAVVHRPDLLQAFPGSTGKYGFHFQFELPLSGFERQEIRIATVRDGQLLRGGQTTFPPIGTIEPRTPIPLLVTSTGRSGSSLLMRQLARHPQIVVAGRHPYEIRQLSYYALALRTLTSDADRSRSTDPETMGEKRRVFSIGFNPYQDPALVPHPLVDAYWNTTAPLALMNAFKNIILQYYDVIRMIAGKPMMQVFAEKTQPDTITRQATAMMFGRANEILLVRDPRDLVCSYRAFWKKDVASSIPMIVSQLEEISSLSAQNRKDILVVKYEDLAAHPNDTMHRVQDFLCLERHDVTEQPEDVSIFERHGTSRSPADSIGRWRTDLSANDQTRCNNAFERFLHAFGYVN